MGIMGFFTGTLGGADNKILSSKTFKYLIMVFVAATAALFLGKLTADLWTDLMKWLGAFGTARGTTDAVKTAIQAKKNEIQQNIDSQSDAALAADVLKRTGTEPAR